MENSKVLAYLEALESKIRKLVDDHQELKTELKASMEENRALSITAQHLEDEIQSLNHKRADSSEVTEGLEEEIRALQAENSGLLESINNIQRHFEAVQQNSDALIQEYDHLKELNDVLMAKNHELESTEPSNETVKNTVQDYFTGDYDENDSIAAQLKEAQQELEIWKEKAKTQEEALKNFLNQEKNSKIVESIAEESSDKNDLKVRINEYIKEIDKCIAQLSD